MNEQQIVYQEPIVFLALLLVTQKVILSSHSFCFEMWLVVLLETSE